jgi:hypothetical protein
MDAKRVPLWVLNKCTFSYHEVDKVDIHQIIKIPIDMSTLINTNKTVGGVDKSKLGVSNSSVS